MLKIFHLTNFTVNLVREYPWISWGCPRESREVIPGTFFTINVINVNVNDNLFNSQDHAEEMKAYPQLVFGLAALAEIVTFKSSITGAWKVEPSTFTILTEILDPTDKQLAEKYPAVQFAILSTLFCHSQRCNNFIPSSKTKTIGHTGESLSLISLLCKILSDGNNCADVK